MRVLLVNTEKSWRGGEKQTFFLLRELKAMGVETGLIARSGSELLKRAGDIGVKVFGVSSWGGAFFTLCKTGADWDIVHAQSAKAHTACAFASLLCPFKLCYTRRVLFSPRGRLFNRFKYSRTDGLFAVSNAVGRKLEQSGFGSSRVIHSCIEPWPVDEKESAGIFASLGIGDGKKVVVSLAALDRFKDPFCELDAVERLKAIRQDFVFVHFGSGELKEQVRAEIKKRGLEGFFVLGGFVGNVQNVLSRADVFVMTSRVEAFANSVLEAFYFKVPCVVSDSGGLAEIAGNGKRAVLCRVGSGEDFCCGIDALLSDPQKAAQYTKAAALYVKDLCSPEKCARQYLDAYKKVLA